MAERFNAGEAGITFTGDDKGLQDTTARVEKTMAQVAAQMKKQAIEIEVAIAKARASAEGLGEGVEKSMRKAAASFRRDAKAFEDSAKLAGESVDGFINNVRQYTLLSLFANGAAAMGKAVSEMSAKIREGKASTGDLVEKIAEGVPILGKFVEAGRGIREAITGEQAYTEVLKEQTAQQEKRIELIKGYSDAIKKLGREQEDLQTRLNRRPGDSAFAAAAGFDITGASRAATDAAGTVGDPFQDQLKKFKDEREALGKQLIELQRDQGKTFFRGFIPASAGVGGDLEADTKGASLVAAKKAEIQRISDLQANLEKQIKKTEELARATIGRGVLTQLGQLVGGEFVKGFDAAGAAIERYIARIRPLNAATESALALFRDKAPASFSKFNADTTAFSGDLAKGNISQGQFNQLQLKANLDEVAGIVSETAEKLKTAFIPLIQLGDSYLGAPIAQTVQFFKKAATEFQGIFPGSIATPNATPAFRASFEGLTGFGNRIQAGAGSESGTDIAKRQLKQQEDIAKAVIESTITLGIIKDKPVGAIVG
jgi:hypothetical protein